MRENGTLAQDLLMVEERRGLLASSERIVALLIGRERLPNLGVAL